MNQREEAVVPQNPLHLKGVPGGPVPPLKGKRKPAGEQENKMQLPPLGLLKCSSPRPAVAGVGGGEARLSEVRSKAAGPPVCRDCCRPGLPGQALSDRACPEGLDKLARGCDGGQEEMVGAVA